jgi:hypothetical protein
METTFKIRASGSGDISAKSGLTDSQIETVAAYSARRNGEGKALTDKMSKELDKLLYIQANPELPDGAKTYCEKWLNETIWKRRKELKNKYVDKGNRSEEDGFTLLCVERELGMVYKNVQFFQDDWFQGTPDLIHEGIVYDNKCSWDLDTFPMYKKKNPNQGYWWQLQVYMELTGCRKAVLAYTLIDADLDLIKQAVKYETDPEKIYRTLVNMIYTRKAFYEAVAEFCPSAISNYFVEIPDDKRIKTYSFDYDSEAILFLRKRVEDCRTYINSLLN